MRTSFQAGRLLLHPKWQSFDDPSAGHKGHWYSRLPYNRSITRIMKSLKFRPLLSFLELLNSGRLTWLFLLRFLRSSLGLKQELLIFLSEETHSHWHLFRNTEQHNLWCLTHCRHSGAPNDGFLLMHWKHFLSYPEHLWISRNAF